MEDGSFSQIGQLAPPERRLYFGRLKKILRTFADEGILERRETPQSRRALEMTTRSDTIISRSSVRAQIMSTEAHSDAPKDMTEKGLMVGDIGTVVHIYDRGAAFEVEFTTILGSTTAVVTMNHPTLTLKSVADADSYVQSRAARGSSNKLIELLDKAPDIEPESFDQLTAIGEQDAFDVEKL